MLLRNSYSSSFMWAANVATVSPSADCADGKVHFTPANLLTMLHRSVECSHAAGLLKTVFADPDIFYHHKYLPAHPGFADEGAANHNRLCSDYHAPGVELFVYGRDAFSANGESASGRFPARQALEASQALARLHRLDPRKVVYAQQASEAIDQGVFHNDVVAVANKNVLFFHQQAFADSAVLRDQLRSAGVENLCFIEVPDAEVPLRDAVDAYLFNSQLVSPAGEDDGMALVLPLEAQETDSVYRYLQTLLEDNSPINRLEFVNVRQSMSNGGGPACLRLRVALTERQLKGVNPAFLLDEHKLAQLEKWVERYYRDRLCDEDLADPWLMEESFTALDELTRLLGVGAIYDFQR